MPTTTNIALSTPAHAASVNTWDTDPINNNSLILDIVAGSVTSKSLASTTPVTLTATEAQSAVLRFSGTILANITINVSAIRKTWVCENNTLGAFVVIISGGSGNVVALPPGSSQVYWDGTNVSFINLDKIGAYWDYAGSAVPAWVTACTVPPYLLCDGSSFSAVTYPLLNAIMGTTTLPDSRARARIPLNGGSSRVTTAGSGIDGDTRFSAGGKQTAPLTEAQLPVVSHATTRTASAAGQFEYGVTGQYAGGAVQAIVSIVTSGGNFTVPVNMTQQASYSFGFGSGDEHVNMQPSYIGGVTLIRAA